MDSNAQIISDLQIKIGYKQPLDFLSDCKGVPVVIKGHIFEVREKSIIFKVQPPDSVCMSWDEYALILHDIFISGIQGRILALDLKDGTVELGEFSYSDRGFGGRAMVRVRPEEPIEAQLVLGKNILLCQIVDLSLNGFGLLAEPIKSAQLTKGSPALLKLKLLDKKIEIPGTLLGIFSKGETTRMAMSFSQDAPGQATVARYITRRRAEIRQEIQTAYQKSIGDLN
jgi:hypothetical protein